MQGDKFLTHQDMGSPSGEVNFAHLASYTSPDVQNSSYTSIVVMYPSFIAYK
jgi:hypothetical protein